MNEVDSYFAHEYRWANSVMALTGPAYFTGSDSTSIASEHYKTIASANCDLRSTFCVAG